MNSNALHKIFFCKSCRHTKSFQRRYDVASSSLDFWQRDFKNFQYVLKFTATSETDLSSTELSIVLIFFALTNRLVSPSTVWMTKFSKRN